MTNTADTVYSVLTLETGAAAVEDLADRARDAFGVEPVQLLKPEADRAWVDLYFADDAAALQAARATERWPEVRGQGLRLVRPRDWQRFWRRHFRARNVGERLAVVPEWDRTFRAVRGRKVIRVRPGLSFGTGDHFTTRFCLEAIDRLCRARPPASLLDAGTGSGILAIAAAKLGVRRVDATDHDPRAVEQARINLRLNRVSRRVRLRVADIVEGPPPERYAVVCANLYGGLLIRVADRLCRSARRTLVLSGIREIEADAVAEAFLARGARAVVRDSGIKGQGTRTGPRMNANWVR